MKMYDICNDSFITDRAEIIDRLVEGAAETLTFSERRKAGFSQAWGLSDEARGLLKTAVSDSRAGRAVGRVVQGLWCSEVQA